MTNLEAFNAICKENPHWQNPILNELQSVMPEFFTIILKGYYDFTLTGGGDLIIYHISLNPDTHVFKIFVENRTLKQ